MTIVEYVFRYCKNCKLVEYTDELECEKCNNNYVLLSDYIKEDRWVLRIEKNWENTGRC